MYGGLGSGSVKNVRRKISSTDYTIKYYPDPDDSRKRQKVVVEEETKDIELTMEELKMAFRWVGEETEMKVWNAILDHVFFYFYFQVGTLIILKIFHTFCCIGGGGQT